LVTKRGACALNKSTRRAPTFSLPPSLLSQGRPLKRELDKFGRVGIVQEIVGDEIVGSFVEGVAQVRGDEVGCARDPQHFGQVMREGFD
jgi:hypothetical protein